MKLTQAFNELLKKQLNEENNEDHDNICLISKEQLKTQFIKLSCGHCFNYEPIFNEVIKQKLYTSYKETQKLDKNCIKCPYCRTVQKKLLPQHPKFKKIKNVNTPLKYCMENPFYSNNCEYVFKSGKNKDNKCNVKCFNTYCTKHEKQIKKSLEKKLAKEKEKEKEVANIIIKHEVKNEIIQIKETIPLLDLTKNNTNNYSVSFKTTCDHYYVKGKNKGKKSNEEIIINYIEETNSPNLKNTSPLLLLRKRISKKHSKLKMYKNFKTINQCKYTFDSHIIEPNIIPIKMTEETLEWFNKDDSFSFYKKKNIIKTTCKYYLKNNNYSIKGFKKNNFSQVKLVKKVFKI